MKDARCGWWEAFKFAASAASKAEVDEGFIEDKLANVIVDMDYEGGHFRPAGKNAFLLDRSFPLAFLLNSLGTTKVTFTGNLKEENEVERRVDDGGVLAQPDFRSNVAQGGTTVIKGINARIAAKADLSALASLKTTVFAPHLTSMGSKYFQERQFEASLAACHLVFVAICDEESHQGQIDELIGGAQISRVLVPQPDSKSLASNAYVWYASSVVVAEKARGYGVGKLLMHTIITAALQSKAVAVFLHVESSNLPAVSLYSRLGFREHQPCPGDRRYGDATAEAVSLVEPNPPGSVLMSLWISPPS